jgi:hypothetical protein
MDNMVTMCRLLCNEYIACVASQKNDHDLNRRPLKLGLYKLKG